MNSPLETAAHAPATSSGPTWSALAPLKLPLHCPMSQCGGTMFPHHRTPLNCDPISGLSHWVCGSCWHQGMTSYRGLWILFTDHREYVVSYGPSVRTLTVVLSLPVISLFRPCGMSSAQLAISMAEWTLLTGRTEGTIQTSSQMATMAACYEYFQRYVTQNESSGTTP